MPYRPGYQHTFLPKGLQEWGLFRFLAAGIGAGILFTLLLVGVVMLLTAV